MTFPAGFALIDDVKAHGNSGWVHVTWGRDCRDGWMVWKTTRPRVIAAARKAFHDQAPVRLHSDKWPYLDRVEWLGDEVSC